MSQHSLRPSCLATRPSLVRINAGTSACREAAYTIHCDLSDAERQRVFAFRYAIIVRELGVEIPAADHRRRVVIDPEDCKGHIFAAFKGDVIIGTARVNLLRDGPVEPHNRLLGLDRMTASERDVTSVSSRFLVSAAYRSTPVAIRMTQTWFRFCRALGLERDYLLVKPNLAVLYVRLGYLPAGGSLTHPEVGEVLPLRLHFNDDHHLRSVGSPFVSDGADRSRRGSHRRMEG